MYRNLVGLTIATTISGMVLFAPVADAQEVHKVRSGESLWSIARKHNMDVDTLARINGIRDLERIQVGTELRLSEATRVYKVQRGDSLWTISQQFNVNYQELIRFNNIKNPDRINVGMEIRIPPSSGPAVQQQRFIWPLTGRISSPFGPRWGRLHNGIDIAVPIGRNVVASASGQVVWGGWINGYGHTVIIDHNNGYRTLYAHNSQVLVTGGDTVRQGQVIARSGNSGVSTGPHLHFEIQRNGKAVDPMIYLR